MKTLNLTHNVSILFGTALLVGLFLVAQNNAIAASPANTPKQVEEQQSTIETAGPRDRDPEEIEQLSESAGLNETGNSNSIQKNNQTAQARDAENVSPRERSPEEIQ